MNPITDAIAAIYLDRTDGDQDWMRLAVLRPLVHEMVNVDPAQVEAALLDMVKTGYAHLVPCSNRKVHKQEDHDMAIVIGGEPKHLFCIEAEYFDAIAS